MSSIAKQTPGFSGADLANLINEGALLAARRNKKSIELDDLTEAIDRVIAGPGPEESRDQRSRAGAYRLSRGRPRSGRLSHAGGADMVWKISIVSRGQTGGYTRYLPEEDRYLQTLTQFLAMLATAMGGRQAEVIKFGEVTTGASNDIEVATRMARQMVTRYGMSAKLGLRSFGRRQEAIFLGREISEERDYSIRTENLIDSEVSRLLDEGRDTANQILSDRTEQLDGLAQFLLEFEDH